MTTLGWGGGGGGGGGNSKLVFRVVFLHFVTLHLLLIHFYNKMFFSNEYCYTEVLQYR